MSETAVIDPRPELLQTEPIIGWRAWRVLPWETLDGTKTYRLCAVGTGGIPKVWEPRRPVVAVCSDFKSTHEAPWPGHQCGVYGVRDRAYLEEALAEWVNMLQGGESIAAWAAGRVSLWGRVVECEKGWRAQFAYPFALTVYGDEAVARAVRDVYAVDVEREPALEPSDRARELRDELAELRQEITETEGRILAIRQELAEQRASAAPASGRATAEQKWWAEHNLRKGEDPLYWGHHEDSDYIAALVKAIAVRDDELRSRGEEPEGLARSIDVARVMSPNFASDHTCSVGATLFAISRFRHGVRRFKLEGRSGTYWTPTDGGPTGSIAKAAEQVEENPLDEPAYPIAPRVVLKAVAEAADTKGGGQAVVRFADLLARVPEEPRVSPSVVCYRLGLLRRNGFMFYETLEHERLWGVTAAGWEALT